MALTLRVLKEWSPEIAELAQSARDAATSHTDSAAFYRSLIAVSTWEGRGSQAARSAMKATAGDHDLAAENLGAAAGRMQRVHEDAEELTATINRILNDAAMQPVVEINETTNEVIPPDTRHMTDEYASQVATKVTDLRARIADVLAEGERIDAELANAIAAASDTAEPVVKTATSLKDLLLPGNSGKEDESRTDHQSSTPDSLDGALTQLTGGAWKGTPDEGGDVSNAKSVPLDPVEIEEFAELARQRMLDSGVPPEQIEQRLQAAIAAAQKPLQAAKPPDREPAPKPTFIDGFHDGWFNTEEGIKNLIGANGWERFKDSWSDTAESSWNTLTNPVDFFTEEVERLRNYPEHYLGEVAGGTALTAPGALFGGEAALAARGATGTAIPDSVVDMPSSKGAADHPGSAPLADVPGHHGLQTPRIDTTPPPPLPPNSPLFDGYDPAPVGPEFTRPDGGLIYPDDSLPSKPYAIPGTVIDNAELPQGTVVDRFGYPGGAYLSPEGVPFAERALPPDSVSKPYYQYVVDDPSKLPPGWRIEQSQAAPWFNQPGGGTQYRIIAPDGQRESVQALIDSGYLKELAN